MGKTFTSFETAVAQCRGVGPACPGGRVSATRAGVRTALRRSPMRATNPPGLADATRHPPTARDACTRDAKPAPRRRWLFARELVVPARRRREANTQRREHAAARRHRDTKTPRREHAAARTRRG